MDIRFSLRYCNRHVRTSPTLRYKRRVGGLGTRTNSEILGDEAQDITAE